MKNLLMTKSSDCKSDLVKAHASRPYKSTGKHFFPYIICNWNHILQHFTLSHQFSLMVSPVLIITSSTPRRQVSLSLTARYLDEELKKNRSLQVPPPTHTHTHVSPSSNAVPCTNQRAAMPRGWEDTRRSGATLTMLYRLNATRHLGLNVIWPHHLRSTAHDSLHTVVVFVSMIQISSLTYLQQVSK